MVAKLYLFRGSPAVRAVQVTARALGIALEQQKVDIFKKENLSPAYLKLNPQHTVPTFDDNGVVMWDSHAINSYLVRKYAKDDSLYPKDFHKRAMVDQRLHFDSGVLFPFVPIITMSFVKTKINQTPAKLSARVQEAYAFLEKFLEGHKWVVCDDVTIADFSLVTTVTALDYHVKVDPKTYPNIAGWIKGAQALPCFDGDHLELKAFTDFFDAFK